MPPPKDPIKRAEWLRKQSESHRGKTTWMKGKKHKPESNEINRQKHLGKTFSADHCNNLSKAHKGQIPWQAGIKGAYSNNHIKRLREAALGNQRAKGYKHTDEWKRQQSVRNSGENNPFYNKTHTDKTKCNISKANMGKVPWIKDKTHSPEVRALIRESRLRQVFPQKDTKPEIIMQKALNLRGVKYVKHAPILGQPDVFIEPNLCVFVDGDATHGNPRFYDMNDKIAFGVIAKDRWVKDQSINRRLIQDGYKVLRIWQDDLKTDADKCVQFIEYFRDRFLELA